LLGQAVQYAPNLLPIPDALRRKVTLTLSRKSLLKMKSIFQIDQIEEAQNHMAYANREIFTKAKYRNSMRPCYSVSSSNIVYIKQMYQSGEDDAAAGKRKKQLQDHLGQLEQLFAQHIEASPSSRLKGKNLNELTLGQLKQALAGTKGVKERKATAAREQGFTGGVGDAAKAGYEAGSAPQQAAAGGAPAPAPA
jgi:hypothetical protein